MQMFDAIIGSGRLPVSVEYDIDSYGQFKHFFVVIGTDEGPIDIKGYLSTYEIDLLQFQCQMHHREQGIDSYEAIISRTAGLSQ